MNANLRTTEDVLLDVVLEIRSRLSIRVPALSDG